MVKNEVSPFTPSPGLRHVPKNDACGVGGVHPLSSQCQTPPPPPSLIHPVRVARELHFNSDGFQLTAVTDRAARAVASGALVQSMSVLISDRG